LPVFFNALPLKIDFEENRQVFDAIFLLYSLENPFVFFFCLFWIFFSTK